MPLRLLRAPRRAAHEPTACRARRAPAPTRRARRARVGHEPSGGHRRARTRAPGGRPPTRRSRRRGGTRRHSEVGEEELVEGVVTDDRADLANLEPGQVHRDEQDGDAAGARLLASGAHEEVAEVGHRRVGRPHLLAVDDILVGVADGPGAQRSEVGPGPRFGEPLAPDHVAAGDPREVVAALLVGAVAHDRRTDPVDVHVLRPTRLADRPQLFAQDRVLPTRRRAAAVFDRPVRGQPAALGERGGEAPAEGDVLGRSEHGRGTGPRVAELSVEERPHLFAEGQVLLRPAELHVDLQLSCASQPHRTS